jgi:hypothetical protein
VELQSSREKTWQRGREKKVPRQKKGIQKKASGQHVEPNRLATGWQQVADNFEHERFVY